MRSQNSNPLEMREYSSLELSKKFGVSLRQLQWWDEQSVVRPARITRHARRYSVVDAAEVKLIAELRRKGLSLQEIRRLFPKVRQHVARGARVLITNGRDYHFGGSDTSAVKWLFAAKGAWTVVDLSDYAQVVRA